VATEVVVAVVVLEVVVAVVAGGVVVGDGGVGGLRVTSTRVTALSRPAADPLRGQRPQLGVAAQPGVALEAVQVDQHRQLRAHPTGLGQPPGLQARRASPARASARR
jgi:hypothetical protein